MESSIIKAFEQFGPIESVESASRMVVILDTYEMYVTFVHSVDAYKAFISNRNGKKSADNIISVLPIDTWKIADKDVELPEIFHRMSRIEEDGEPQRILKFDITGGSLLRIFEACMRKLGPVVDGLDIYFQLDQSMYESSDEEGGDSGNVSQNTVKFNENDAETQQSVKEQVDTEPQTDPQPLTEAVRQSKQDLQPKQLESNTESNSLENYEFEKRVAEVWVKHLHKRLETLSLRKFNISRDLIGWLAPILKQCKKLLIDIKADCNILYALHEYCPNVTNFHLDGDEWNGDFEHITAKPWPSLKELYLNIASCTDDLQRKFRLFIAMNPQMTVLQIESVVDVDTVAVIGQSLLNLNTLAFVRDDFKQLHRVADNLVSLTELRGLKITALEVEKEHLNKLSKCAKRLSQMHHLHLSTIFLNLLPGTAYLEDFRHLSEFCIIHHHNCKCHAPNRVLSFEDTYVRVPNDSSVLVLIVNTKPPQTSGDPTLDESIQREFDKTAKFFPNVIETVILQEENNWVYIHISSNR